MTAGHGGRRPGAGARPALSDWEVDELIAMRRRGASVAEMAARFSLSERTVRRYMLLHAGGEGGGSHAGT